MMENISIHMDIKKSKSRSKTESNQIQIRFKRSSDHVSIHILSQCRRLATDWNMRPTNSNLKRIKCIINPIYVVYDSYYEQISLNFKYIVLYCVRNLDKMCDHLTAMYLLRMKV